MCTSLAHTSTFVNTSGRIRSVITDVANDQDHRVEIRQQATEAVFDDRTAQRLAKGFKALGDPTRLHLLSLIMASPGHQACVCHLTGPVGLSQPTVSHHMKLLVDARLVTREQRGKWAFYAIIPGSLDRIAATAASMLTKATNLSTCEGESSG